MLVKEFTTEFGFVADKWIITSFPYTRLNATEFDCKIIAECFLYREDFLAGKKSFTRICKHVTVTSPLTLNEMYTELKKPILKEVPQEQVEGKEVETVYEDTNFFKDATDLIV